MRARASRTSGASASRLAGTSTGGSTRAMPSVRQPAVDGVEGCARTRRRACRATRRCCAPSRPPRGRSQARKGLSGAAGARRRADLCGERRDRRHQRVAVAEQRSGAAAAGAAGGRSSAVFSVADPPHQGRGEHVVQVLVQRRDAAPPPGRPRSSPPPNAARMCGHGALLQLHLPLAAGVVGDDHLVEAGRHAIDELQGLGDLACAPSAPPRRRRRCRGGRSPRASGRRWSGRAS